MSIQWNAALKVGITELDHQHRHFIGLLNRLYEMTQKLETDRYLDAVLAELITYAQGHFSTEERYFDRFGYPGSADQRKEHRQLYSQLLAFQERFRTEGTGVVSELLDFLENWLVDHLEHHDKKYAAWFEENDLLQSANRLSQTDQSPAETL